MLQMLLNVVQDAEYMEQKKSERESRGNRGWSSQARQQELDEADRFKVALLCFTFTLQAMSYVCWCDIACCSLQGTYAVLHSHTLQANVIRLLV